MGQLFANLLQDDLKDSSFIIPTEVKEVLETCPYLKEPTNDIVEACKAYAAKLKQLIKPHPEHSFVASPLFIKACIADYLEDESKNQDKSRIERLLLFANFSFWLIDNPDETITKELLEQEEQSLSKIMSSTAKDSLNIAELNTEQGLSAAVETKKLHPTLGFVWYILQFSKGLAKEYNTDSYQLEFREKLTPVEKAKLLSLALASKDSASYLQALTSWFQTSKFDYYRQEFINWLLKPLDATALTPENFINLMHAVKDELSPHRPDGVSSTTSLLFALSKAYPHFISHLPPVVWLELFVHKPLLLEDLAKQTTATEEKSFTGLYRHILRQCNEEQLKKILEGSAPANNLVQLTAVAKTFRKKKVDKKITVHVHVDELETFFKKGQIKSPIPIEFTKFNELFANVIGHLDKTQLKIILKQSITSPQVFRGLLFSESAHIKALIEQFTAEDIHELITQFETWFQEGVISSIALNTSKAGFATRFEIATLPPSLQLKLTDDPQLQGMLTGNLTNLLAHLRADNSVIQGQNLTAANNSAMAEIKQALCSFIAFSKNQAQISEILAKIIPVLSPAELTDIVLHAPLTVLNALFEPQHYPQLTAKVKDFTDKQLMIIGLRLLKEHSTFCPQWFKLVPAAKLETMFTHILTASSKKESRQLSATTRLSLVLLGANFSRLGYLTVTSLQHILRLGASHLHPNEVDYNPYFLSRLRKSKKLTVQPVFDRLAALSTQPDYYKLYSGVLTTLCNIALPRSERKVLANHIAKLTAKDAKQLLLYPLPTDVRQPLLMKLNVSDEKSLKQTLQDFAIQAKASYSHKDSQQHLLQNAQAALFREQFAKHSVLDKLLLKLYNANSIPQFIRKPIYNYFKQKKDAIARLATIELNYSEFVSAKNFYKNYKKHESEQPQIAARDILCNSNSQLRKARIFQIEGEQRTIQLIGDIAQIERVRQKVNLYRLFKNYKISTPESQPKQQPKFEGAKTYIFRLFGPLEISPEKLRQSQQFKDLEKGSAAPPLSKSL